MAQSKAVTVPLQYLSITLGLIGLSGALGIQAVMSLFFFTADSGFAIVGFLLMITGAFIMVQSLEGRFSDKRWFLVAEALIGVAAIGVGFSALFSVIGNAAPIIEMDSIYYPIFLFVVAGTGLFEVFD